MNLQPQLPVQAQHYGVKLPLVSLPSCLPGPGGPSCLKHLTHLPSQPPHLLLSVQQLMESKASPALAARHPSNSLLVSTPIPVPAPHKAVTGDQESPRIKLKKEAEKCFSDEEE